MTAYYNEFDPHAAAWLRELISAGHIAPGDVDERSITEVKPDEIMGYTQHHFFAGIGGWSYAARLAGWPDDRPLLTGSPPCQPFSIAGKQVAAAINMEEPARLLPDGTILTGSSARRRSGRPGICQSDGSRDTAMPSCRKLLPKCCGR